MKAFLIDPKNCLVTEAVIPSGYEGMRDAIGCHMLERTGIGQGVDVVFDEEGKLEHNWHYMLGTPDLILSGKSLVVGVDEEGNWTDVPHWLKLERVARHVNFLGNDQGLEKNIQLGFVQRPQSTWCDNLEGKNPHVFWTWQPHDIKEHATA